MIIIKDEKKLIYVNAEYKGFGFGYKEKENNYGFVLYTRIKMAARLMWADSASDEIKCAVEVNNTDNAAELDFLLEFILENNESQKITKQLQEEVGNSNDGFFFKML